MTEKELEQKLVKVVKDNGGVCLKFTSPGTAGVPDRLILFQNAKAGFVEVKKPGKGKLSALQRHWLKRLMGYGFPVFVLDDPEEIQEIVRKIKCFVKK